MTDSLIIRSEVRVNFTTLTNSLINDTRLSADDLGMLVYLLSKPNDWIVRVTELRKRFDIGRDKVYRLLRQLEQYGYVVSEQVKIDGKFAENRYVVSDLPCTENPYTEKPYTENTTLTKDLDILNNNNTNLPKKNVSKKMLLADWTPDDACKQYATDKGLDWTETFEDIRLWNEKNGNKASYASLTAFWQQWCRKEAKDRPARLNRQQWGKDTSIKLSGGKKIYTLAEWKQLPVSVKEHTRRNRPDAMEALAKEYELSKKESETVNE